MSDDPPENRRSGHSTLGWFNEVGVGIFLYLLAGAMVLASVTLFMLSDSSDITTLQLSLMVAPMFILLYMSITHAGTT